MTPPTSAPVWLWPVEGPASSPELAAVGGVLDDDVAENDSENVAEADPDITELNPSELLLAWVLEILKVVARVGAVVFETEEVVFVVGTADSLS